MKTAWIFAILTAFTAPQAFSHGENVHGPHDGFIKMPGAFHTELVAASKDTVNVYLLDITFKNPTVKNSKVAGKLQAKDGTEAPFTCSQEKDFFQCKLPAPLDTYAGGKITLMAERDGQKGVPAVYTLPLKLGS